MAMPTFLGNYLSNVAITNNEITEVNTKFTFYISVTIQRAALKLTSFKDMKKENYRRNFSILALNGRKELKKEILKSGGHIGFSFHHFQR
jgi:predicted acetyltransferase